VEGSDAVAPREMKDIDFKGKEIVSNLVDYGKVKDFFFFKSAFISNIRSRPIPQFYFSSEKFSKIS
jgi:hypothetical protein